LISFASIRAASPVSRRPDDKRHWPLPAHASTAPHGSGSFFLLADETIEMSLALAPGRR
jgi:hypothetical protein